jgi:hypothetical protein
MGWAMFWPIFFSKTHLVTLTANLVKMATNLRQRFYSFNQSFDWNEIGLTCFGLITSVIYWTLGLLKYRLLIYVYIGTLKAASVCLLIPPPKGYKSQKGRATKRTSTASTEKGSGDFRLHWVVVGLSAKTTMDFTALVPRYESDSNDGNAISDRQALHWHPGQGCQMA